MQVRLPHCFRALLFTGLKYTVNLRLRSHNPLNLSKHKSTKVGTLQKSLHEDLF